MQIYSVYGILYLELMKNRLRSPSGTNRRHEMRDGNFSKITIKKNRKRTFRVITGACPLIERDASKSKREASVYFSGMWRISWIYPSRRP